MAVNLFDYLSGNEYPGRGIAIGRTPCGKKIRVAYWIMGRSENSRNRIFVEDGENVRTEAFDESKMIDPSLIIYYPVRVYAKQTIVTNGDQTDTIYHSLQEGGTFGDAIRTRTFEPDAPNYTPRISAKLKGTAYRMSIIKSIDGNPEFATRQFFEYPEAIPGFGHVLTTYEGNGSPIPSFVGEPQLWEMVKEPFDAFSDHLWEALNEDNKISLFTRQIDVETGEYETKIYNKNQK